MTALFGIFCILSLVAMIFCYYYYDSVWPTVISGVISCIFWIALLYNMEKDDNKKPKEFSSSKYQLELKVTEFRGQMDTTFVLIPK